MFKLNHKQRHWFEFLVIMTEKEIKTRYKHVVLGFLWAILNPLLQMIVIGFVFRYFMPVNVDNYFTFLFCNLLIWNFFSSTLTKNTPMFLNERYLIKKAKFPRESIVISIALSNLFHLIISYCLLLIVMLVIGQINQLTWLFLLPFGLIWLTLLTIGLSLITSSLNIRFRDINFFVQAIVPIWFYATPVVYTLNLLPKFLQPILYLNPITPIIEFFQFIFFKTPIYSVSLSIISFLFTLIILFLGIFVFKKEEQNFDDWL